MLATAMEPSTLLQVILTVRDEGKWHQSVKDVIVRLYRYLLQPFFWHTHLGRQYTAIIGWNLEYMFNGEADARRCSHLLRQCAASHWLTAKISGFSEILRMCDAELQCCTR